MNHSLIQFPKIAPKLDSNCRHSKQIDLLSKIATNNDPVGGSRIAASIVYKNSIIAIGSNKIKTHPFQAKYGKNNLSIHLHAETDAIKNALKILTPKELTDSILYICRVKYIDETKRKLIFGLAKPCEGCFKAINTFGIKKVVYSLNMEGYTFL